MAKSARFNVSFDGFNEKARCLSTVIRSSHTMGFVEGQCHQAAGRGWNIVVNIIIITMNFQSLHFQCILSIAH